MELHTNCVKIFILCLLCVACASERMPPKEIAKFRAGPSTSKDKDLSKISIQKTDRIDEQTTENPRDKRGLGLLLSGLAQIFGYTMTPVQVASLQNPNVMSPPTATSDSSRTANVNQQAASSRPANTTVPKQQETIRFTGVVNFGNNSDIIGQLQRYEEIFHGRENNSMTTSRPASSPVFLENISDDPRMNEDSSTKPPLLAPFFVKIPLPIAPNLLPLPPIGNLEYPTSVLSVSGSNENTEIPVRKEQMVHKNNEDAERYTMEEDEPIRNKQQNYRYNELPRKQEEHIRKPEQQKKERNRDKTAHYDEEERRERYRNREEEIADEEDEGSAERHKGYVGQQNLSNESSRKQPPRKEKEESEDYSNYNDNSNKQFNGYKQPDNFNKYVEIGYNAQQLPIGDYFHEGNPEVIRDSYGEVLDNKKLEDDRIAGYINMFRHPYVQDDAYDSQRVHNPEDTSKENVKETSAEDGYNVHLTRLQKLREEYALPENKYEEYDLNDKDKEDISDRESERIQNRTSVISGRPKTGRLRDEEDDRARRPTGPSRDRVAGSENTRSQEELDFTKYVPLVVPIRYIDANNKVQQAATQQLDYKEADKSPDSRFSENNAGPMQAVLKEKLTPQIGLPERPRQLHEGEHKELQIWPPPFDYIFDNTEPAGAIVPPNSRDYYSRGNTPNYYHHVVRNVAAQEVAANDKSSEQPSGYLVVVGNPVYPYRYPYNIYYFSNETTKSPGQVRHPHAQVTHPQDQVYVAQPSAIRQVVQAKPNATENNLNESVNSPSSYYYQEIPAGVFDRYKEFFGEHSSQAKEPFDNDVRSQIPNTESWSSRIYRPQAPSNTADPSPQPPVYAQLQNIASLNQNAQSGLTERPHHSRLLRRKSLHSEDSNKNDEKTTTPQPNNKPFHDPQSAHDFFGFSKDDYNFEGKSDNATKVAEENDKTTEESDVLVTPEPAAYHHDVKSSAEQTDEPENDTEKAKVTEYRNKVATLKVSERRQFKPNGPIHYVDFIRNI